MYVRTFNCRVYRQLAVIHRRLDKESTSLMHHSLSIFRHLTSGYDYHLEESSEKRCSDDAIIVRRSDGFLNERLYSDEAAVFRGSDVQKKRQCSERAILSWRRNFLWRAILNWTYFEWTALVAACLNLLMRGRPHLTDHDQSDPYLQVREKQSHDEQILILASR